MAAGDCWGFEAGVVAGPPLSPPPGNFKGEKAALLAGGSWPPPLSLSAVLHDGLARSTTRGWDGPLCECSFNNPNANDMHLMGHIGCIFKKKVSPGPLVGIKAATKPGIGHRRS